MIFTKKTDPLNFIQAKVVLRKIEDQKPYFSLTGRIVENGRESVGGAIHDEILAAFPELDDLVAMHLSDIDGRPMNSFETGKYWAGFTKWENGNAEILANHFRIGKQRSQDLMYETLVDKCNDIKADTNEDVLPETLFKEFHDRQLRRWKQEADNVIKKYSLKIVAD